MSIEALAQMGGIFALLVFWHFVVDWLFQSHNEAMKKSHDAGARAFHCAVYTLGFVMVMPFFGSSFSTEEAILSIIILFFSHFIEDTYYPVFLWTKHVRKPPEFGKIVFNQDLTEGRQLTDREAFIEWFGTPLGKIIGIVVDQLVHIAFLLPIAYFVVN